MVPAGYLAKRVAARPERLAAERVSRIYSISKCISGDFADYIQFWKHNGYWLFDSPEVIIALAREHGIDLAGTTLFFYEVHEQEFDAGAWEPFEPEPSFETNVSVPAARVLEGYDVATFSLGTAPQCSPLSCNNLAATVETNAGCLLESFDQAVTLLENGTFSKGEPGPHRIFAVYSVAWPDRPGLSSASAVL